MNSHELNGMEIKSIQTFGWRNAIIGMRLPKNSEDQIDSVFNTYQGVVKIGQKDFSLLLRLSRAGVAHRKVLRMLHVQGLVKMPISWWIQYDTYKVATVANSRSRMHKFGEAVLDIADFYIDDLLSVDTIKQINSTIEKINILLFKYKDKETPKLQKEIAWKNALELLPMNYLQERMIDLNYETLLSILELRYNEKLQIEWRFFCNSFLADCPYLEAIWLYTKKAEDSLDPANYFKYRLEDHE